MRQSGSEILVEEPTKGRFRGVQLPETSRWLLRLFATYSRWYVHRHFHAVRILRRGSIPEASGRPLVIFLNHASWWDPLVSLLVAQRFFRERRSFAPIDACALQQYQFFARLGFFGVALGISFAPQRQSSPGPTPLFG
ncbi:MAG: hypothetical protein ACK4UN_21760 [Limisphaerales bacterium]